MAKLTLKEIAGYLPYDLQILCNSEEEEIYISTMVGLHLNGIDDNFGNNWYLEVKPLLYPLEMLTKTIVHNGVEIIPREYLVKQISKDRECTFAYFEEGSLILLCGETVISTPIKAYEILHELHIDIHNLIERGLAISKSIDKSTLNSK